MGESKRCEKRCAREKGERVFKRASQSLDKFLRESARVESI